jgi:membrane dipeptidase
MARMPVTLREVVLASSLPLLVLAACAPEPPPAPRGADLARRFVLVDTHIDLPMRLVEKDEDISVRTPKGDFDLPRAREGGLDAPFMSIYVPAEYQKKGGAKAYADRLIDKVEELPRRWPDAFAIARTPEDVRRHAASGLISLPMGMENGAAIEDDLGNLRHFFDRGVRYITLTHSEDNQICDSSYNEGERRWRGLSPFGRHVVQEMNRIGMMVDVSHVSDDAFSQVLEIARAPVIASHSSCRRFTPGFERNLSDDMIRAVGANGGVVMINFGSAFLTERANKDSRARRDAVRAFRKEHGIAAEDDQDERLKAFREQYRKDNPPVFATMDDVVAHIDHAVKLAGIDHVGLGSDFEGVGDSLPEGLKDVSGYPNLIDALLAKGYSEGDIEKICGGNLLRVWTEVEAAARALSADQNR